MKEGYSLHVNIIPSFAESDYDVREGIDEVLGRVGNAIPIVVTPPCHREIDDAKETAQTVRLEFVRVRIGMSANGDITEPYMEG